LVFASFGQLTSDDTDDARDIFRYDMHDGSLRRVSVGEAGYASNGNGSNETGKETVDAGLGGRDQTVVNAGQVAMQSELRTRAVSEDGARILFKTAEPLSPGATNGLVNVYEWHDGDVSLLSTGTDEQPIEHAVITPSGGDVFFVTVRKLLAQDTDEAPDVYDARLGADFPMAVVSPEACSGDACQGPLTNPAPLLAPDSLSPMPVESVSAKKRLNRKAKTKCLRRRHRRRVRVCKKIVKKKRSKKGMVHHHRHHHRSAG
jgi:hypothetical protein